MEELNILMSNFMFLERQKNFDRSILLIAILKNKRLTSSPRLYLECLRAKFRVSKKNLKEEC